MSREHITGIEQPSSFPLTNEQLAAFLDRLVEEAGRESPLFEQNYRELCAGAGTTLKALLEMPQHYPAERVVYQKDHKFLPVSPSSIESYTTLGNDADFVYVVHPQRTRGYAVNVGELNLAIRSGTDVLPALVISLRDTAVGVKQAHALRIRERYGRSRVATSWYVSYVQQFAAIASDFEHLEGGLRLWRSLIRNAGQRGLAVSIHSFDTGETKPVDAHTPLEDIWSTTPEKRNTVIVLQKAAVR